MRSLAFGVLLVACAQVAGDNPPDLKGKVEPKPKTDQESLQGIWVIVGLETAGKAEPEKNYRGNTFTFVKDKATLKEGTYPSIDFTFAIDPTKTPKTIELSTKSATIRGIYKLEGDELTLCLSIGATRPAEFATKLGGDTEIFTLKRSRWERYTDKAFGFTVDMPGKPEERKRETTTSAGKLTTTLQVVRSDMERVSYLASVTPLPGKLDSKQTEAALEAARNAMIAEVAKDSQTTIETDTEFKVLGLTGRELTIGVEVPDSKAKGLIRVRVFVTGERVYGLMVSGNEDGVKAANVARFWGSFRPAIEKKKN